MRQVYVPDESEERAAAARRHRMRRRIVALAVLLGVLAGAWLVFGPLPGRRPALGSDFRSEVVPPVPVVGPADSAYAARRAPFRVQVAAVETRDKASGIATKLRVDGWTVDIVDDPRERRYLVQVGPYVSRSEAEQAARQLRGAWGAGVLLVERR